MNTAARVMSRAEPNQILPTEDAWLTLAGRYEPRLMGLFTLKGKAEPMPLYSL